MDLQAAAQELYALPAADFAARRTELSKQARAEGAKDDAAAIAKLRKPVQSAALINALVRTGPRELDELREVAEALRTAHRELRGTELRELSAARSELLGRLTELVRDQVPTVTEPVLAQVRATFEAAVADAEAEAAVLSGQLTAALSYAGFGEVDLADAVALPGRHLHLVPSPGHPAQKRPDTTQQKPAGPKRQRQAPDKDAERRERAVRAAEQAAADLAEARGDRDEAEQDLTAARTEASEAAMDVERLQAEIDRATERLAEVQRQRRTAERHRDAALRSLQRAEKTAGTAQAALEDG